MGNYKEDTDQNSGMFFLLILFLLFVFASSGNPESRASSSAKFPSQNELVFGSISGHRDAIISCPVSLPDLQKYCECALHNSSLIPFSIRNKISDYNRRISRDFILIRKTRLSIEPALHRRLCFHLPLNKDDDLPVLS
jgi:hypothetical protein